MGIGETGSMRHQLSFISCRARTVSPPARAGCDCLVAQNAVARRGVDRPAA
jgi:hypothetical protein